MAGLGAKLFASFTKLTAADVNGYLADQSIMRFASTAARDAAFGGAGEPTLAEGMTCYLDDTNVLQSYNGSGWVEIASSDGKAPRGIISATIGTAGSASVSTETVIVTSPSFTAVANRYYRITYFQPVITHISGTVNQVALIIRLTNIAGTAQAISEVKLTSAGTATGVCQIVKTLPAGSTVFVATFAPSGGGSVVASGASPYGAQLMIEDIGGV